MKMKYQIILSDPPWKQKKGGKRNCRPHQGFTLDYPTLSVDNIFDIHDQIVNNCCEPKHTFFIWTIDKFLHECEEKMNERKYKLHARLIWDKENGVAPAFTIRYSHEYLLWFYKPSMIPIAKNMRGKYTTVLREKSTYHSHKPEIAHQFIEDLYPDTNKLELFARQKRTGWDVWGKGVKGKDIRGVWIES